MTDAEFHRAFLDLSLSPAGFRHADHIRAAWCCFRHTGDFAAGAADFIRHFRRFVAKIGAEAKYHETITWYYLTLVHRRMACSAPGAGWDEFRAANPDLFDREMRPLKRCYRQATLESALARRVFVLPDAAPSAA
jgi:hypothetical protein